MCKRFLLLLLTLSFSEAAMPQTARPADVLTVEQIATRLAERNRAT